MFVLIKFDLPKKIKKNKAVGPGAGFCSSCFPESFRNAGKCSVERPVAARADGANQPLADVLTDRPQTTTLWSAESIIN